MATITHILLILITERSARTVPMLQIEQVVFIELAHFVAVADGIISEKEQELFQLYKQEAALSDEYQIQNLPLEEIPKVIESETSKDIALLVVLAAIFSDGTYSDDEKQIVKLIKQSFGFTPEKV
jgi:tellurite resistance protein